MLGTFSRSDWLLLVIFSAVVLTLPWTLEPIGAAYPDLLQKFAIYGIFAVGFNILFGLTGYLSFGHAAFLGVGSYAAVWSFKLLTMNVLPALALSIAIAGVFALLIGYISLRRAGIYFSILTLAFAQMSYNLAYSVLTPITNGETGLQVRAIRKSAEVSLRDGDVRIIDQALGIPEVGVPITNLFGMKMSGYPGFYFCAVLLIVCFFIAMCISRSNFGMMLKAIKSNQNRLNYTGIHTRPYLIAAFVISGMYAGLAGSLLSITDPIAGAERMQWTASGEVVLMTILGGAGTLVGPVLGAGLIKYAEQKVSSWNEGILHGAFSFLPEPVQDFVVEFFSFFVGEGWHLTLGLMFMIIVIFLPGGVMEGFRRLRRAFANGASPPPRPVATTTPIAERD
ncbi:branched-chain amino acid ABC transporter permease [Chelativorans salis]|uniref:Branched-chain amino acid ABC transporter permease n=1 Tax=Chelativorans salis TaxID=2978478 RepID=A0ABT2LJ59_9HYPH|nr:branched-chain amino acid ABC transporter permease [Chelativorans sp. EGI FJ00035]MCT7374617.1 branched-chain amino acid ABC transporter permease [Chelativorans sp. EGI FJ00035]